MSAIVIPFHTPRARSDNEIAEQRIRSDLAGFAPTIVSQAIARANRLILTGMHHSIAASRATAWARCAIHPEPPSAA